MNNQDIIYNENKKEIQFLGKITSYKFYSQLFDALREHYKSNGKDEIPTFSFVLVDEFDALVIPNLISIGVILKQYHKGKKIQLKILNTSATKFLDSINFFNHVGERNTVSETISENGFEKTIIKEIGIDIYQFEKRFLGFYDNKNLQKSFNPDHKLQIFRDDSYEYYKNYLEFDFEKIKKLNTLNKEDKLIILKDIELLEKRLDTIRTEKYYQLEPQIKRHFYKNILYKQKTENNGSPIEIKRDEKEVKTILKILTELVLNSTLYSYSNCSVMIQSKDNKTKISISDTGIGLLGSLKYKPNFDYYITKSYSGEYKEKLERYLLVFDALHYSMNKNRENLFTLLQLIINNGGKMRIHYDNVQVIFTTNRCYNCEIIPEKCYKCLLSSLSNDKNISPVRLFDNTLKGIHIEVELDF